MNTIMRKNKDLNLNSNILIKNFNKNNNEFLKNNVVNNDEYINEYFMLINDANDEILPSIKNFKNNQNNIINI